MAQPILLLIFVYVERIRPVHHVDGFPMLRLLRSLSQTATLYNTIEFEAAILIHWRERVARVLAPESRGCAVWRLRDRRGRNRDGDVGRSFDRIAGGQHRWHRLYVGHCDGSTLRIRRCCDSFAKMVVKTR